MEYDFFAGDVCKKGAEVVIEKIKDAEGNGSEAAGQKEDKDKDKGGLISDILGGDSDKKEGGEWLASVPVTFVASVWAEAQLC